MKRPIANFFKLSDHGEQLEEVGQDQQQVIEIPIERIVPNRFQPRAIFDDERIDELSQTIDTHGMIQPIIVRKWEDQYEIIAGERRWLAVRKLGWKLVPAIIKNYNDTETASVALIENLQREELTAIEEAQAYAKLIEIHGLTQESLAHRLGKGQSTVANKLRLLKLPQAVQDALLDKTITERHARALISVKSPKQQEKLLAEVHEKQLNVKQLEERIKKLDKKPRPRPRRKAFSKDTRLAINTIRQSIDMVTDSGMDIDTQEREEETYYEITIRIPKK